MEKRDMKADAILMHRERNIIAVRAAQDEQTVVQVFDMEATQKLKNVVVAETVVYWRWITANKMALVGKNAVYHMDITNSDQP